MGKKISQLTIAALPYEGEELFAMVEDSGTKATPLSTLQTFLSGQSYIASPDKNNFFGNLSGTGGAVTQTFVGDISSVGRVTIGGGALMCNTGAYSSILGGNNNTILVAPCSIVAGGNSNCIAGGLSAESSAAIVS